MVLNCIALELIAFRCVARCVWLNHNTISNIVANFNLFAKVQEKIPVTPVLHTGQEYKVIFVGDASVGKTSLIRKIGRGTFNARRESTTSM